MMSAVEPEVYDNPERSRVEIRVDGKLAGFVEYQRKPGVIAFTHTEIDPVHKGHGLGSDLVAEALAASRAERLVVLPICPFVKRYLEVDDEFIGLVPPDLREQFGLATRVATNE